MFTETFPQAVLDGLGNYGPGLATAVLVLVGGWFLSRWLSRLVTNAIPARRAFDDTLRPLTAQLVRYGILIIAIVIALGQLGVQTTSVLAVLGAAGLAVALALQGTLSNLAAGIMLIWLRPLRAGEYIDVGGIAGTVVEIGLFATRLRSAEGLFVFSPNNKIWDATITNYSRDRTRRFDLIVGIAYDADIARARKVMLGLAGKDARVLKDPAPVVYVNNLGASSVDMLLRVWTRTADYWEVRFELNEKAKLGFDEAGIEIPFPHLTLVTPDGEAPAIDANRAPGRTAAAAAATNKSKS
ncbi:MAG TPA: mechanosensitive ion channel domain-containing protein [Devosiaceae bacterium]|nr:mechanosensitive ion channel domain-containing protein [Devosiaceae bacterium]